MTSCSGEPGGVSPRVPYPGADASRLAGVGNRLLTAIDGAGWADSRPQFLPNSFPAPVPIYTDARVERVSSIPFSHRPSPPNREANYG